MKPVTDLLASDEYKTVRDKLAGIDMRNRPGIDVHLRPLRDILRNLETDAAAAVAPPPILQDAAPAGQAPAA